MFHRLIVITVAIVITAGGCAGQPKSKSMLTGSTLEQTADRPGPKHRESNPLQRELWGW